MRSLVVALWLTSISASAATTAESMGAALDRWVRPLAERRDVAGTFLVAKGDRVVLCKSFGFANVEHAVPNKCATRYMIGSISKQFTAAAILALEEDGKLSIEDPLAKYLPDFPSADKITLRMMLTHRSGIGRDLPNAAQMTGVGHTTRELVDLISRQPLDFVPGTRASYSNNAYRVLAWIIESVSGERYGQFLEHRIFDRAGMHDTGDRDDQDLVQDLATGYDPWIGTKRIGPAPIHSVSNARGPASLYSTVRDLLRWNIALGNDSVLSQASRKKMLDEAQPLGTGIRERFGLKSIGHDGVYFGYTGFAEWYPASRLSVIYLGNIESGASVAALENAFSAIALGKKPDAPPVRPSTIPLTGDLSQYAGTFTVGPIALDVRIHRGHLLLGAGEGDFPLEPIGRDEFFYPLKYARVTFQRDSSGHVNGLSWSEGGGTYAFTRKEP